MRAPAVLVTGIAIVVAVAVVSVCGSEVLVRVVRSSCGCVQRLLRAVCCSVSVFPAMMLEDPRITEEEYCTILLKFTYMPWKKTAQPGTQHS